MALDRILRQLTRKPKRRHQRKNDLRAVTAAYPPFTRFQMDVKSLADLPFYRPQRQANGGPRFQYTLRELSCGTQFLACSHELSKTCSTFAADRFLQHLKNHGVDPAKIILTTDRGVEFDGDTIHCQAGGFHWTIEQKHQAKHRFNPPACPNAHADVESVHATSETEGFEAQVFSAKTDFFAKTATGQFWDNAARKNSSRKFKSPADWLARKAPKSHPKYACSIPSRWSLFFPNKGATICQGSPLLR